jgi:IGR protein motif
MLGISRVILPRNIACVSRTIAHVRKMSSKPATLSCVATRMSGVSYAAAAAAAAAAVVRTPQRCAVHTTATRVPHYSHYLTVGTHMQTYNASSARVSSVISKRLFSSEADVAEEAGSGAEADNGGMYEKNKKKNSWIGCLCLSVSQCLSVSVSLTLLFSVAVSLTMSNFLFPAPLSSPPPPPLPTPPPSPVSPLHTDKARIEQFLTQNGLEEFADNFETWEQLMTVTTRQLKEMGLSTIDRKFMLRRLEKYRQMRWFTSPPGFDPTDVPLNGYADQFQRDYEDLMRRALAGEDVSHLLEENEHTQFFMDELAKEEVSGEEVEATESNPVADVAEVAGEADAEEAAADAAAGDEAAEKQ